MLKNLYANKVLMIRPTSFYYNVSTATDNKFMEATKASREETTQQA